jgi:hypothetical protein
MLAASHLAWGSDHHMRPNPVVIANFGISKNDRVWPDRIPRSDFDVWPNDCCGVNLVH